MITSMHIENFKCFKDFDIELGPFNVLVGPNDSGKTAFLQAVRVIAFLGRRLGVIQKHSALKDPTGVDFGPEAIWKSQSEGELLMVAGGGDGEEIGVHSHDKDHLISGLAGTLPSGKIVLRTGPQDPPRWARESLAPAAYYRFDPAALKRPCALSSKMREDGSGFASYLDEILRKDRGSFDALEGELRNRFPEYTSLTLPTTKLTPKEHGLKVAFKTAYREELSASSVSDGVMLSLAFLAITHAPAPPRILLIEEPENGVHHASLKDTVQTLKQLSGEKGVQVILTTHSPYLVDQMEPKDVRVFYKDDEGAVHAGRLSDHPEVASLKKHFRTGEIWTGFESDEDIVKKVGSFE